MRHRAAGRGGESGRAGGGGIASGDGDEYGLTGGAAADAKYSPLAQEGG